MAVMRVRRSWKRCPIEEEPLVQPAGPGFPADQNRLDDAIRQFGTALRLLGHRVPKTRFGWLVYLIWQTAIQVLHLLPVVGPVW